MGEIDRKYYEGQALSTEGLIDMLEGRGLTVTDRNRANQILQNVSYTRLKAYLVPLMISRESHQYKPGATFEDAYAIYGFDRRLRELVFHETEKIEISFRARISLESGVFEKGLWYTNPEYFRNRSSHAYMLRHIMDEIKRCDNDALKSFTRKYSNEYPPCWLILEAISMGTLVNMFDSIIESDFKRDVAAYYGLEVSTLVSWLKHIVYIRNLCAHHSRLWNKDLKTTALYPERHRGYFPSLKYENTRTIYFTFCVIKYLQDTIKPTNTFSQRLSSLIGKFPVINPSLMGFPLKWEEDRLWKVKTKPEND